MPKTKQKKMHKNNKKNLDILVYYYNIICWHVTPAQGGTGRHSETPAQRSRV